MRELHPDVQAMLDMSRDLRQRIAEMRERADAMLARRPSPSGLVIPEVDVRGRLVDLYLAPGTCDRFDNQELAAEIMAAINESTDDVRRQYQITMNDPDTLKPPPVAITRTRRTRTEPPDTQVPSNGKAEE